MNETPSADHTNDRNYTTIRYTAEDFVAAYKLNSAPVRRYVLILILAGISFFLVFDHLRGKTPLETFLDAIGPIIITVPVWVICYYVMLPWQARHSFAGQPLNKLEYRTRLCPEGLVTDSDRRHTVFLWKDFIRWRMNDETPLIYLPPRLFQNFPSRLALSRAFPSTCPEQPSPEKSNRPHGGERYFLMSFFRRLALHRFIKAHPPSRQVSPAPDELVVAYENILPASLIELWRRKGLGFYGKLQFALIDPRPWQPVLDRWIVSPQDDVRRIPIALTPFSALLYYRKLTATDEDVAYIDPVSKKTGDLAWGLDEFFNRLLCEREPLGSLIPSALVQAARKDCGALEDGEVYEVNQLLFSMQMLQVAKVDALDQHRRLRDAVDPPQPKDIEPTTVASAVPAEHRAIFEDIAAGQGLAGLYLSSYLDWHRLLALQPDGQYRLLFWRIRDKTFERTEIRLYTGSYQVSRSADGDDTVELDITLRANSLGSDANDECLVAMRADGTTWLLRADELASMATAIGGWDEMGRSEYYFRHVTLDQVFEEEPSDGRPAPPFAELPRVLQALIHVEPLRPMITHVAEPNLDEEEDGEGTVMCRLDLGTDDGLRMNMPLWSPPESGRRLRGWVWRLDPHACQVGIKYRCGQDGRIAHGPVVGDVLTTRAPS